MARPSKISRAFDIIRQVTKTMVDSRDLQPALDAVVTRISAQMEIPVCSIYLFNPETGRLHMAANCGLNAANRGEVSMDPAQGLTGHVFRSGEVLNLAEPAADPRYYYFPVLGEDEMHNFLGVPIPPSPGQIKGVLTLQSAEPSPFPATVEDLAFTLAAQLGSRLENHSLLASTRPVPDLLPDPPASPTVSDGSILPFIRAQVAFGGIAVGPAQVLRTQAFWDTIIFSESSDTAAELTTLRQAIGRAIEESRWLQSQATKAFAEIDALIFDAHVMMLQDESFIQELERHVRDGKASAFAIKLTVREFAARFHATGIEALKSKSADIMDIGLRLLNALGEVQDSPLQPHQSQTPHIVVAHELLPSDLIYLQTRQVLGIVCETGGATSHAAILARNLSIPCLIGVPGLLTSVQNGTELLLDSNSGLVFVHPDIHVRREYQRLLAEQETHKDELPFEPVTQDGVRLRVCANISLISDLELMVKNRMEGVGLYRSEFLFMIRNQFPDEETQTQIFTRVVERSAPHSATIRLLDVGGDKPLKYFNWGHEENPYLGWRSIRMLLERPEILRPHLRALLRASNAGNLQILVPMMSSLSELFAIQKLLQEIREELTREGVPVGSPRLGVMIEVPSAVFQIERILREVDFVCVGSNDLIQYLLAVDRGNERVSASHTPYHPAFILALDRLVRAAEAAGKPLTLCGELAGDLEALPMTIGLGVTGLSMSPALAQRVRETLNHLNRAECQARVEEWKNLPTSEAVQAAVQAFWKEREPKT